MLANGSFARLTRLGESTQTVDWERLEDIANNDAEMIKEVITMFFCQAEETLPLIEKALETKDAPVLLQSAHKLAGAAATCGFDLAAQKLRALEDAGRSNNLSNTNLFLTDLRSALEATPSLSHRTRKEMNKMLLNGSYSDI